jgi:hypothetical protein
VPRFRNEGYCPREADGQRIHATLFNGIDTRDASPQGWPADGRGACNWRISRPPHPYDIKDWEIAL